jgi:hypothetical protein
MKEGNGIQFVLLNFPNIYVVKGKGNIFMWLHYVYNGGLKSDPGD